MSDGLNRCAFLGNLGSDPELKTTQGGSSVLKFTLAVNSSYLDKDNNKQENVEWVRCTIFGKRAEGLSRHLAKGDKLYVAGEMRTSKYQKEGVDHYSTEIIVNEVVFAGSKRDGGGDQQQRSSGDGNGGGQQSRGNGGGGQQRQQGNGNGQRSTAQGGFDTGRRNDGGNGAGYTRQAGNGGNGGGTSQRTTASNGGPSRNSADDFGYSSGGNGDDEIPF